MITVQRSWFAEDIIENKLHSIILFQIYIPKQSILPTSKVSQFRKR